MVIGALVGLWTYVGSWRFFHSDRWLGPLDMSDEIMLALFPLLALALVIGTALYTFSLKVVVDPAGIEYRHLLSAGKRARWEDLESIGVPPVYGGVPGLYTLVLRFRETSGRLTSIIVPSVLFRNGRLVKRAILEAALRVKPVPVYSALVSTLGRPPYGIFPPPGSDVNVDDQGSKRLGPSGGSA